MKTSPLVAVGSRYARGDTPGGSERHLRVLALDKALTTNWIPDQHFATYVVRGGSSGPVAPRLRKDLLPELLKQGYTVEHAVRVADCDMPGHAAITPDVLASVAQRLAEYPCGWYPTRGGLRVYQTLTRPLSPGEYEVSVRRWLPELQQVLGGPLVVDRACQDWTRMFRLPRVVREGRNYWDTQVHEKTLKPIDPGDCTPPPAAPKVWTPPQGPADVHTRYGAKAIAAQLAKLANAKPGEGHFTLVRAAFAVGQLIAGGELHEPSAVQALQAAISGWDVRHEHYNRTLRECVERGRAHPWSAPRRKGGTDLEQLRRWLADRAQAQEPIRMPDLIEDGFGVEEV